MENLASPQARLRMGLAECMKRLANANITSHVRQELEIMRDNILQTLQALSPEHIEEARRDLGHEPTKQELILHFVDHHAKDFLHTPS
ncbi:MAG TPA: hypothetical protein VHE10_00270 [Candidatus Paceibacterota bacterium]|nr:hypothetical protein [Candidatus Paceibacterota bacterium]